MFTKREIEILKIMIKNKSINLDSLSNILEVSSRTLLRDFSSINNKLERKGVRIISENSEYSINISNSKELKKLENELIIKNSKNIEKEIFLIILNEKVDIFDISEKLFYSISFIYSRVRNLKSLLRKYEIVIETNRDNCFVIKGDELAIRKYLKDEFMVYKDNVLSESLLDISEKIKINEIKKSLYEVLYKANIILSDIDFSNIVSLILIAIYRNNLKDIKKEINISPIVKELGKKIFDDLGIELSDGELNYIHNNSTLNYNNSYVSNRIENIVFNSIKKIKETSINNYDFNDIAINSLKVHISYLIKRNLAKIKIHNPIVNEVKKIS